MSMSGFAVYKKCAVISVVLKNKNKNKNKTKKNH